MRLVLVRHGESVDNVAGLYAGSRDSRLTNHGVLQARRLGAHLAARSSTIGPVKHIFASNLQRAVTTAEAIAKAQVESGNNCGPVEQLAELREKDFGSDEGKRFGTRHTAGGSGPSPLHVPPESQEAMMVRIDRFIDHYLFPLLTRDTHQSTVSVNPGAVVVVAHGIILNVLLRSLLSRFGPEELIRLAGRSEASSSAGRSDWLASWSNTGYLEAQVWVTRAQADPMPAVPKPVDIPNTPSTASSPSIMSAGAHNITLSVKSVNCVEHLQGLKKTRGGIGSSQFDAKQKTVDSFFMSTAKKRKPGGDTG